MQNLSNKRAKLEEPDVERKVIVQFEPQTFSLNFITMLQSIPKLQSENQQLEKVELMYQYLDQIKDDNTESYITVEFCNELKIQIGKGKKVIERALLNLVGAIVELRVDIAQQQQQQFQQQKNIFFDVFYQSSLFIRLEDILFFGVRKDEKELKSNEYSQFTIQAAQIVAFINKNNQIEIEQQTKCGKVLCSHIKRLDGIIKKSSKVYNKNNLKLQEKDEIEKEMIAEIKTLKAINGIINSSQIINCLKTHQIQEIISQCLHFNCPSNIRCCHRIKTSQTVIISDLLGEELKALAQMYYDVDEYLYQNYKILEHIAPIIISFAQSLNQHNKLKYKLHSSLFTSIQTYKLVLSPSLIEGALQFLFNFHLSSFKRCKQAFQTPGLLAALMNLTLINKQETRNNNNNYLWKIRQCSNICLYNIQCEISVNREILFQIINDFGFIKVIIEGIGSGGGNMEENSCVINSFLQNIKQIHKELNYISKFHPYYEDLRKSVESDIEEGGGKEEIDIHLFHSNKMRMDGVKDYTYETKQEIINNQY